MLCLSCASSYKAISPQTLYYPAMEENENLVYGYQYDVLSLSHNRRYAKKEKKRGIRLMGVKITNLTDRTLVFRDDVVVRMGDRIVYPLSTDHVRKQIRQIVPLYLLYSFLTINISDCNGTPTGGYDCDQRVIPIGVGIAAANVAVAANANAQFRRELQMYNVYDKEIKPGQTIHGLMAMYSEYTAPLTFRVKQAE